MVWGGNIEILSVGNAVVMSFNNNIDSVIGFYKLFIKINSV